VTISITLYAGCRDLCFVMLNVVAPIGVCDKLPLVKLVDEAGGGIQQ
jgi:hypothetical protein